MFDLDQAAPNPCFTSTLARVSGVLLCLLSCLILVSGCGRRVRRLNSLQSPSVTIGAANLDDIALRATQISVSEGTEPGRQHYTVSVNAVDRDGNFVSSLEPGSADGIVWSHNLDDDCVKNFRVVAVAQKGAQGLDVVMVADYSGSMRFRVGSLEREMVMLSSSLRPQVDRLGLVAFDHRRSEILEVGQHSLTRSYFEDANLFEKHRGETCIFKAVDYGVDMFGALEAAPNRKQLLALFTDGEDNCGEDQATEIERLAGKAVYANVVILAVGIGDANNGMLQALAESTGGYALDARNSSALEGHLVDLVQTSLNYYDVSFDYVCLPQPERIELTLSDPEGEATRIGRSLRLAQPVTTPISACPRCPDCPESPVPVELPSEKACGAGIEPEVHIYFDYSRHQVSPVEAEKLQPVIDGLLCDSESRVILECLTDVRGSQEKNDRLALNRCNAVRDQLTSRGVKATQIDIEPLGEGPLPSSGSTHQENRRATIHWIPCPRR